MKPLCDPLASERQQVDPHSEPVRVPTRVCFVITQTSSLLFGFFFAHHYDGPHSRRWCEGTAFTYRDALRCTTLRPCDVSGHVARSVPLVEISHRLHPCRVVVPPWTVAAGRTSPLRTSAPRLSVARCVVYFLSAAAHMFGSSWSEGEVCPSTYEKLKSFNQTTLTTGQGGAT